MRRMTCQQCQGAGDGWWMRTIEAERWGCGPPLQYLARWVGQGTGGMRLPSLVWPAASRELSRSSEMEMRRQ